MNNLRNRGKAFVAPGAKKKDKRLTPDSKKVSYAHINWRQCDIDRIKRISDSLGDLPKDNTKILRGAIYLASRKGPQSLYKIIIEDETENLDQTAGIKKRYSLRAYDKRQVQIVIDKIEDTMKKKLKSNRVLRGGLLLAEQLKAREFYEAIKAAEKDSILSRLE